MSSIIFSILIIEVTRRCNMSCKHCMRGDAQNIDMDLYILDKFLSNFKNCFVREILFTGGEPTLKPEIIAQTLRLIKKYNITVKFFAIITNGKNLSDETIDIINSNNFSIAVSVDDYHEKLTDFDYSQLRKIKAYFPKKFEANNHNLYNLGRAKENNIGVQEKPRFDLCFSKYHDNLVLTSKILCTCDGDVLKDCGFCYYDDSIYEIKLCEYDDNILEVLREKVSNSIVHNLEEIPIHGSNMYKFLEYLKKNGIEI